MKCTASGITLTNCDYFFNILCELFVVMKIRPDLIPKCQISSSESSIPFPQKQNNNNNNNDNNWPSLTKIEKRWIVSYRQYSRRLGRSHFITSLVICDIISMSSSPGLLFFYFDSDKISSKECDPGEFFAWIEFEISSFASRLIKLNFLYVIFFT